MVFICLPFTAWANKGILRCTIWIDLQRQVEGVKMSRWYYKLMGEVIGPITVEDLLRDVADGSVFKDTQVRKNEDGEWKLASSVKNLFDKADEFRKVEIENQKQEDKQKRKFVEQQIAEQNNPKNYPTLKKWSIIPVTIVELYCCINLALTIYIFFIDDVGWPIFLPMAGFSFVGIIFCQGFRVLIDTNLRAQTTAFYAEKSYFMEKEFFKNQR